MKKIFLGVMALSLALVACKKDEDAPTKSELLTNGSSKTWAISKFFYGGQDITDAIDSCSFDDNFVFRSDFTFEVNEGETKCDSEDPQISESGVWALIENDTKIVQISDGITDTATVLRLTEGNLDIESVDDGITNEIRFVKK